MAALKVGVTLPQFRADAEAALEAGRRAERLGLDGVFVFDHLWPMGSPDRPIVAAMPLMGALAAETSSIAIGSLVLRIGLLPDDVLIEQVSDLGRLCEGRFIAGLGTGDRQSRQENLAFGLPYPPATRRRASLEACARALRAEGLPVWIGAGSTLAPPTLEVARGTGSAINLWDAAVAALDPGAGVELTWGGPLPGGPMAIATRLEELAAAGASWVVCAWPESLDGVAEARRRLG